MKKAMGRLMLAATMFFAGFALQAKQIKLDVSLAQPTLLAGKKQITYLKVALTGFERTNLKERAPVNIALVIDESGSMSGEKIEKAKEAAILAIRKLGPKDIVSIITYDSTVNVLVPATKVSDKDAIIAKIRQLDSGGGTALYAGVSKGAAEVRKFLDRNRVNRIILISDGQANVGPSSPGELAALGRSFAKDRISITTIGLGLGYNEDLMAQLAAASDGSHAFAENGRDLIKIFNYEFDDVLSVVAQEIQIKIRCDAGVRPVRVLGRHADIIGQDVTTTINQLYSEHEKYILLEVEVPAGAVSSSRKVACVDVSYGNMETNTTDRLKNTIEVAFSNSEKKIVASKNKKVMVDVIVQKANIYNSQAMKRRDKGEMTASNNDLLGNVSYITDNIKDYEGVEWKEERLKLEKLRDLNKKQAEEVLEKESANWNKNRKAMKEGQNSIDYQQRYDSNTESK